MLTASGVWGVVHEPQESGPFNAGVLDNSPAILNNIDIFDATQATPDMVAIGGGDAGFGPRAINLTLMQVAHSSSLSAMFSICSAVWRVCCKGPSA